MFAKLSLFLITAASLVTSIQIAAPENPHSASFITINWTNQGNDFTTFSLFSVFLINPQFNNFFALANNVANPNSQGGSLTLRLPVLTKSEGYTLEFTNIGNQSDVFAQSPQFSINLTPLSVSTSVPSTSSGVLPSGRLSSTGGSATATVAPSTPTPFGTTLTTVNTPANTANTATGASVPSSSPTGVSFNAAQSLRGDLSVKAFLAVLAAALAGVVAIAA